jgi:hypothetical protein
MDTLKHIIEKYKVDTSKPSPIALPMGRNRDLPKLFNELGFKVGAEIGVHKGRYSRSLCTYIPGLKLYGVDLWEVYGGYIDFGGLEDGYLAEAYLIAQENTQGLNCEFIKDWSSEAVKRFEDGSLDFVFIDGNHAYEYVVEDIALWSKKVRKGGIVSGHDFHDFSRTRRWDKMGVIPAVEGWTTAYKIKPWFITTHNTYSSWFYVKE